MGTVLAWLFEYRYMAMFGILVSCGLGLPVPEEITLIGSGLLVGWHQANFVLASLACVLGILVGDSIIFGLGHHYGRAFLDSRVMRVLLSPKRRAKVERFFDRHGLKAVFLARFFTGVRIGIYAFAGSQRMSWLKFLALDLLGALISGPTSILVGKWAAQAFADDPYQAMLRASETVERFAFWLILGAVSTVMIITGVQIYRRRRSPQA